jgi:hypothetical protein
MVALNECVCTPTPEGGGCLEQCAGTCSLGAGGAGGGESGAGGDSADCMACQGAAIGAACADQWAACGADYAG